MSDLFKCFFPNCQTPDKQYLTKEELNQHVRTHHRKSPQQIAAESREMKKAERQERDKQLVQIRTKLAQEDAAARHAQRKPQTSFPVMAGAAAAGLVVGAVGGDATKRGQFHKSAKKTKNAALERKALREASRSRLPGDPEVVETGVPTTVASPSARTERGEEVTPQAPVVPTLEPPIEAAEDASALE